ncbi:phospholipase A and acyltransferase 4-like [Thunnus thynnus]|uniref:phospholipase A and acyltransferase 4-like n=1 Tax=Thunnus thynnus TaxID=8237 RepID=UPI003529B25C
MLKTHTMGASAAKEEEPEPGDLIEIFRGRYQHWTVYIGGGYIVHLVSNSEIDSLGVSSTVLGGSVRGQVKKEKLKDVVNKDDWKISNIHDNKWDPRPKQEIVKEALSMVGKDMEYSITELNCEHFATECRYGKALSVQVLKAAEAVVRVGAATILDPTASGDMSSSPSVQYSP